MRISGLMVLVFIPWLFGCDQQAVNSPYPDPDADETVMYSSFNLRPKHLDPARSYSANESLITGQIYEPPFQYHYLKRPYQLEPLTAEALPEITLLDSQGEPLPNDADPNDIAFSRYTITIRPGIAFQPHPAFSRDKQGNFLYHQLSDAEVDDISTLNDFKKHSSRELQAQDYVYQIKRLAHPQVHSPILGLMSEYIVGLRDYAELLGQELAEGKSVDLRDYPLAGVKVIDKYRYQITVYGQYPQLKYWLAMPFFAPVPWEAVTFYQQPGLQRKNMTLDWYPVGTGPYHLIENDPNRRMTLVRNPFFHGERYPSEGSAGDKAAGLLVDAGKTMPFIDRIVFTLEKESTAYWNKFLQGYYDISALTSDSFEQAINISPSGDFGLSESMKELGIALHSAVGTTTFYMGFNMLDPIVGGYTEKARKLRHAIAIAVDQEENISIFANGQGIPAQGPIPPGIFGYRDDESGIDNYVYDWVEGEPRTKSIKYAKQLLAEAGYPKGRDAETGEPLVLYFDVTNRGPDSKAQFDWVRKQFQKLNIQLVVRSTDYNRFQEKMRSGNAQIFQWGWSADYPDPENFLFLLYGPNGKRFYSGENAANYQSPEFDSLFEQMRLLPDGDARQKVIDQMVEIARNDAPWIWGFHPKRFTLFHAWNKNIKTHLMANNTMKYQRIDVTLRDKLQKDWNQPTWWPIVLFLLMLIIAILPAWRLYQRRKYQTR
ncbi:ABC transporter substrate-binding protein [Methylophaga sp. OBS3]|uniref:ABC transporter substrate-binding protein n=1 Tax=Methylophaga sp. OBS3 TaxID=2991934 RepID=UPI002259A162|nr:ABC transporter substrate-binding protein [Methylophaga sp. OBS3]MCX4188933.1 ABC transporter substrate-binding protein [Methylophaga sp. OBS3]